MRGDVDTETECLDVGYKSKTSGYDEGSKGHPSKTSSYLSSVKTVTGYETVYTSSEDEDVCPTCLEGRYYVHYLICLVSLAFSGKADLYGQSQILKCISSVPGLRFKILLVRIMEMEIKRKEIKGEFN